MRKILTFTCLLLMVSLALSLTACNTPPADGTAPPNTLPVTAPTTPPETTIEPPAETTAPTTEPLPTFTRREYKTMLEGVSVNTWLLTDDTVYIRLEDFLSAAGITADELPETEILLGDDGFDYLPLYPTVETLGYPLWEDTQFSTTYITPSAAAFEIPADVKVPVLMYHALGDELWGEPDLFVSAEDMEAQLQYLLENGYDPIWFSDLKHLEDYDKPVILTFDDGYDDNYDILLPMLEKYQVKATVFVIAGLTEKPHKMSWGEVQTMAQSDYVSIQSHGMYHVNLAELSEEELRFELGDSQISITRMSGKIPYVVCYPEGKYSDLTLEVAARYYHFGIQMGADLYTTGDDPYLVCRYFISRYTSLSQFAEYLTGAGDPA